MRVKLQALRAHLDDSLFPAARQAGSALRRWELSLLVGGLLAIVVVLQLARMGWSASLNSLWAEDGPIYMQEALTHDFWHSIVSTYATYLVLVPRLIAEAASLAPLRDVPAAVSILSALVVGLSGLAVWVATASHLRNPYLRGALVALTVLSPVAGLESLDSAAYVPWYMLFASFWLLIWRPKTLRGAALGGLFILLTGLSTPGLWFFAPLVALRALAIRDRRDLLIVSSYAIGAAVQIPILAFTNETAVEPLWTADIWTTFLQRVVNGAPFGLHIGGEAWSHLGWPFLILLTAAVIAGLAVGFRRAAPGARYLAAIAIPTSLVMFVVSLYQRAVGTQMVWPEGLSNAAGSRYSIVPALLLVSAGLVLLDSCLRRRSPQPVRLAWPVMATLAILAAAIIASFYVRDLPTRGVPPWDAAVDNGAIACRSEHLTDIALPTSPPGFGIQLPCDEITSAPSTAAQR
jgi:hypothetical protein